MEPTDNKLVDIQKIKDAVNFYELAMHFEEKGVKTGYNCVSLCCPFHDDKSPSCVYNFDTQRLFCFSCSAKGDVFDYLAKKLNTNKFKDTLDFLVKFTGVSPTAMDTSIDSHKEYKAYKRVFESAPKKNDFEFFSEEDIRAMVELRGDFYRDRGFSKETLDFFEVGFNPKEKRVVLPVRDQDGALVGATGRTIYKDYKEKNIAKWKHFKGSKISENFYNINNGIKFAKEKNGVIIIVEGPNDVMRLYEAGYKNVIACLRNAITRQQKTVLVKNFMSVYLFLDNDSGGIAGKSSIYENIKGYFDIYDVQGPEGKDPGDLTNQEIDHAFKHSKKI